MDVARCHGAQFAGWGIALRPRVLDGLGGRGYVRRSMLQIVVNGEQRAVEDGTTVAGLVALLRLATEHVAVERNREIVPRAEHGAAVLNDGDILEIVTFVGGG